MTGLDETPTPPEAPPEAMKPRFGRKLYLVIGLAAIAIIATASVIVFTQFLPSARGENVSFEFDYSVGEKMTYEMNMTMEIMDTEVSMESTMEMEVISFDGENYTIRQTTTSELQVEYSYTVKMNKTGYIVEYIELPPELNETFTSFLEEFSFLGAPGFGSYFPKAEAKVGESWEIPFDMELESMNFNGRINFELSEITNVTVPAGTYEAVKIDIKPSVIQISYPIEGMGYQSTLNVDGYIYVRKDVCHLFKFRIHESVTMTVNDQTVSMEMTMQMQLIEHIE